MELKFDILKKFLSARDPELGRLLDKYLATLNDHQRLFIRCVLEAGKGSAYVPELEDPRVGDLVDLYVFLREPVRACKDALVAYDPEAAYHIVPDLDFRYNYLFRSVMSRHCSYKISTGEYNQNTAGVRLKDPNDAAYDRIHEVAMRGHF
ncbi:hypothetical protein ES705_15661 [subsurface metagenome]